MRKAALILALMLLLGLGAGCAPETEPEEPDYVLYFLSSGGAEAPHGPALTPQPWAVPSTEEPPEPEELIRALLAGPTQEGLVSPFPGNVELIRVEWDGENPGKLRVRLSEVYSGLTDISLTLADYAIVLTLAQLEEVESVEILSAGYSSNYRSHQTLTPEEAELVDPLTAEGSLS